MKLKMLRTWSQEIGRPDTIVCEIVETGRRCTDDRGHLRTLVELRLDLQLAHSSEDTFNECSWGVARAYLERGLTKTQAYSDFLMPVEWVTAMLGELDSMMPETTAWYSSERTHQHVDDVMSARFRSSSPLCLERTFESLVAGVAGERTFLFYAWDED